MVVVSHDRVPSPAAGGRPLCNAATPLLTCPRERCRESGASAGDQLFQWGGLKARCGVGLDESAFGQAAGKSTGQRRQCVRCRICSNLR